MKVYFSALLVLLSGFSLRAGTVTPEPFPPARLSNLYVERDDNGATITVQSQGDAVVYKVTLGNKILENRTVNPSGDDWFQFIQALNAAKVYKWAPKYYYPGQGPSWVIDLVMENRSFNSIGTNEYPKHGDATQPAADPKAGPSIPFDLFWQAVLNLVGKTPPPPPPK
jgi:hypothetical protein